MPCAYCVALPDAERVDHGCHTYAPVQPRRCDSCSTEAERITLTRTIAGDRICYACRLEHYSCDHCGGWNRIGDVCANGCGYEDDEDEDDDGGFGGLVHDYSYRPRPVFHGTGPLFLGPEIEIATPYGSGEKCAQIAERHLGDLAYLKEDSSIGEGFEIVSHPMTYDWAMAHFPWPMLPELRAAGCDTPASTGIHVHVSRDGFSSDCHTYRWMKFIYRNQQQVVRLARRHNEQWAAFTDQDRRAVRDYAKGKAGDRYRAINTNNRTTLELRIFAGSLDVGEVQASLAFAAASVEYTRTLSAHSISRHDGWTWPAFTGWLGERAQYAPLSRQLEALQCVC